MLGLGLGPGGVIGACTAGLLHCLLGEILAAAMIALPLTTGVILVAVIVFGSSESSDRVFRLLRWIRDKEEPPAPGIFAAHHVSFRDDGAQDVELRGSAARQDRRDHAGQGRQDDHDQQPYIRNAEHRDALVTLG